jgi:hypothetical protein
MTSVVEAGGRPGTGDSTHMERPFWSSRLLSALCVSWGIREVTTVVANRQSGAELTER